MCLNEENQKIIKLHILHVTKQNRTVDELPNGISTNSKILLKHIRSNKSAGVSVQSTEDQGTSTF